MWGKSPALFFHFPKSVLFRFARNDHITHLGFPLGVSSSGQLIIVPDLRKGKPHKGWFSCSVRALEYKLYHFSQISQSILSSQKALFQIYFLQSHCTTRRFFSSSFDQDSNKNCHEIVAVIVIYSIILYRLQTVHRPCSGTSSKDRQR